MEGWPGGQARLASACGPGRRLIAATAVWLGLVAAIGGARAEAYPYVPDPSFGVDGVLNLLPGNGTNGVWRGARSVEPGPDGTFYVFYRELPGPQNSDCEAHRYLARYLPYGVLDASFGNGGIADVVSPVGCKYPTFSLDEQGRPLFTWSSTGPSNEPRSTLAITRFTLNGTLDPRLGVGGIALLELPCPGGTGADIRADRLGRLILSFGCREDESAEALASPFHTYIGRLDSSGVFDPGFGEGGLLSFGLEAGWGTPGVVAVERNGSLLLAQHTEYVPGVPNRTRLIRVRPDGSPAWGYTVRVDRSLERIAGLGFPQAPEEATDFVLRPRGGIAVSGRSARGGWVLALRHDGSLDPGFSQDGYRRFTTQIRYLGKDRRGRLLVVGYEYSHGLVLYRLQADGNRDRSVGGPRGVQFGKLRHKSLAALVSLRHGLPLLYFNNAATNCTVWEECTEPAELLRLRLGRPGADAH